MYTTVFQVMNLSKRPKLNLEYEKRGKSVVGIAAED